MSELTVNPWQTRSIRQVYDNPWIAVTHREVITPRGHAGVYGVVHFKHLAVGVVPVDGQGYTWLVGQYRYPLDQYSWEIPEGGCPAHESPLATAQRELMEETGIQAARWTKLLELHLSNSVTDERAIAFLAQDLTLGKAQPEHTEQLRVCRLPLAEAVCMARDGSITDALSVAALLMINEWIKSGKWSI